MSHCTVPTWNPRHQRQEQVVEADEANKYPHMHNQQNQINHFLPMYSKCEEVAELTWEKGQLGMHGLGGILSNNSQTKQTLGRANDTLESIVHQATRHGKNQTSIQNYDQNDQDLKIDGMCNGGKWGESSQQMAPPRASVLAKKRMRSESELQYDKAEDEYAERSACGSASATFCRENDTTMVTWPSFDESSRSIKSKTTCDEDSACHGGGSQENKEEEHETKESNSSRRSRAAAVHNQSERRRRDRINQRMKALQRLVPNASKTDKASMLDEVIDYLKKLQAQVQLMSSSARNMAPQMMMPLGMHQHIQMSLLARMGAMGVGLGMGMGMFDMTALARAAAAAAATTPHQSLTTHPLIHPNQIAAPTNPFIPPAAFTMPAAPAIPPVTQANTFARATTVTPGTTNSAPFTDPYNTFLPQPMDMEFFNNMAAMYRQQANQSTQTTGSKLNQGNLVHGQRE